MERVSFHISAIFTSVRSAFGAKTGTLIKPADKITPLRDRFFLQNKKIYIYLKRFLLLFGLFVAVSVFNTSAQIRYRNGKILFGNIETPSGEWCKTAWDGWGHYWGFNNNYGGYTWFKIVLGATNCKITLIAPEIEIGQTLAVYENGELEIINPSDTLSVPVVIHPADSVTVF